jgi:hypothetical protein
MTDSACRNCSLRGLTITQEIAIANLADALADLFEAFGVGPNAMCPSRRKREGRTARHFRAVIGSREIRY